MSRITDWLDMTLTVLTGRKNSNQMIDLICIVGINALKPQLIHIVRTDGISNSAPARISGQRGAG